MIFEEWEFASYFRCTRKSMMCISSCSAPLLPAILAYDEYAAAALIPYGGLFGDEAPPDCMILVDGGYSHTHVVPLRDGQVIWEHVKRYVCTCITLIS